MRDPTDASRLDKAVNARCIGVIEAV